MFLLLLHPPSVNINLHLKIYIYAVARLSVKGRVFSHPARDKAPAFSFIATINCVQGPSVLVHSSPTCGSFARLNSPKQERMAQLILWPSPSVHFASLKIRSTPLVIAAGRVVNFDFSFDEWVIRLPHFFHSAPSNDQFSGIHTPFTTCSTRETFQKGATRISILHLPRNICDSVVVLTIPSSHHLTSYVSFSENIPLGAVITSHPSYPFQKTVFTTNLHAHAPIFVLYVQMQSSPRVIHQRGHHY